MALIDKLTAIGNAIRAKTGGTAKLTLSEMAEAVTNLSTGIRTDSFCQINTAVKDYLENADYSPEDYTVSVVSTYASRSEPYNKTRPFGYEVTLKDSGTLYLCDFGNGNILKNTVSSGTYTVSNLTPTAGGCYLLIKHGEMVQGGLLFPSGALRMLDVNNILNVRDLGGWNCDGGTVKYNKLFRGTELTGNALVYNQITETGKSVMADLLGINYECDLRWDEETYGADKQAGTDDDITSSALGGEVEYIRYPIYYYINGVRLGTANAEITKNCLLYVMEQTAKGKTGYLYYKNGKPVPSRLVACYLQDKGQNGIGLNCGGNPNGTHIDFLDRVWHADETRYNIVSDFYIYAGTKKSEVYPSGAASTSTGSADVKAVQKWLGVTADGILGRQTKTALIKKLQTALNAAYGSKLAVDGVFGAKTSSAIRNIKNGAKGDIVKVLQALLICQGYTLTLDGIFGNNTEGALRDYQSNHGLYNDGIAGKATFAELCT